MSVVTDIILITAIDDGIDLHSDHPNVDRFCNYLKKVDEHAGGKAVQCDVFMAAINYLDEETYILDFKAIQWESPEQAQLMLKGEDDLLFSVYVIDEEIER